VRLATIGLAAALLLASAVDARAEDLPVPSGSRRSPGESRFASSRGFGAAVDFYRRELPRRGWAFQQIGPSRTRGVDLCRFVSTDPRSPWLAVHVYRLDGKTWISFVKRPETSTLPAASTP
jgi:hypothetical protein